MINGQRQYDFVAGFPYIREAGTDGEKKAADSICDSLREIGLQGRRESFSFYAPLIRQASLSVTAPYQKDYTVTGYGLCGNTPDNGIEADFVYLENADEISLDFAENKIVMVNFPVRTTLYQKLCQAGALGFISISGAPLDQGDDRIPVSRSLPTALCGSDDSIPAADMPLPGVTLHYLDAAEMVEKGASRVRLLLKQDTVIRSSQNIAVRIEGSDLSEDILTVTAHYDSVPAGPGAYDNMSGCAIAMELCRCFQSHRPRRTMEFIWFGGEEKGLLGSKAYVKAHEEELARHRFNMNIDLAGQLVGGTVIGITADASVCVLMKQLARKAGIGISVKHQIWSSDSNTFAWKRIPSVTLNRDGFGMHTKYDTIDLISPWSLKRSAVLLYTIAAFLAQEESFPVSQNIPPEFLEQLDAAFTAPSFLPPAR